jgi:carbohydrate diacid regulator
MITEAQVRRMLEEYKNTLGKDIWICDMENRILASTLSPRDIFFHKALEGKLSSEETLRQAGELGLKDEVWRTLFLMQTKRGQKEEVLEILKTFFPEVEKDLVINYSDTDIFIIKYWKNQSQLKEMKQWVRTVQDIVEGDSYSKVLLSSSLPFFTWDNLFKAGKQARQTMEAGRFFYQEFKFFPYEEFKLERLVYSMNEAQCEDFIEDIEPHSKEIFYDKDLLNTATVLMRCQGNSAEAARQLYVHRNTLNYRLEKIKRFTGLDIKKYEDAMIFQMQVLVYRRMKKGK